MKAPVPDAAADRTSPLRTPWTTTARPRIRRVIAHCRRSLGAPVGDPTVGAATSHGRRCGSNLPVGTAVLRHHRPDPRASVVECRRSSGSAPNSGRRRHAPTLRAAPAALRARGEMARRMPLIVIQRQRRHSKLGITSIYLPASTTPKSSTPSTPAERRWPRSARRSALDDGSPRRRSSRNAGVRADLDECWSFVLSGSHPTRSALLLVRRLDGHLRRNPPMGDEFTRSGRSLPP